MQLADLKVDLSADWTDLLKVVLMVWQTVGWLEFEMAYWMAAQLVVKMV
jgi:hypothetical protein